MDACQLRSSHAVVTPGRTTEANLRGRTLKLSSVLTLPADVLNLQVFVGGRARVAKQTVRRNDATLCLILAPGRDVT